MDCTNCYSWFDGLAYSKVVEEMNTIFTLLIMTQLMAPAKESELRAKIPQIENQKYTQIIQNSTLYTDVEMPPAYQHDGGFHWTMYNISGDPPEQIKGHGRGGNGNVEFPWKEPGGTDRTVGVDSFKFFYFPAKIKISREPVLAIVAVGPDYVHRGKVDERVHWEFPDGTVFGEVLLIRNIAFELRIREKIDGEWKIDIFRPFPQAEDLVAVLQPESRVAQHIFATESLNFTRRVDLEHPTKQAIDVRMQIDVLPAFDNNETADYLLKNTVFKSALGLSWRGECFAPTTESENHIVPKNYDGTFLGSDESTCMNCHLSTGIHVDEFDQPRQWYGMVRGSDEIISWHPVSFRSISRNGTTLPISFREELLEYLER